MNWAHSVAELVAPEPVFEDEGGGIRFRWAGCHRFTVRRVDCQWNAVPIAPDGTAGRPNESLVVSVVLERNGQISTRSYTTSSHGRPGGFRRRPRYPSPPELVDLVRLPVPRH